jgi:hypothetical protein
MTEPTHGQLEAIQRIFAHYVLENGEFAISRAEAEEIYHKLEQEVLMARDSTAARYKAALESIAGGAADPVAIAREALRSRKRVAVPKVIDPDKKKIGQIREELRQFRFSVFERWVAEGKPEPGVLGRMLGLSTARVKYCLWRSTCAHWNHKKHPLYRDMVIYQEEM